MQNNNTETSDKEEDVDSATSVLIELTVGFVTIMLITSILTFSAVSTTLIVQDSIVQYSTVQYIYLTRMEQ